MRCPRPLQNCGEYALGMPRFFAFADAVNRTGRPIVISTEPFSITPNPLHGQFAHFWRTGNDISASYGTITNRADLNEKWAPFTGPGAWAVRWLGGCESLRAPLHTLAPVAGP